MNAVIDTNILIDNLNGVAAARTEIARYETVTISVVTWIEVMAGAADDGESNSSARFSPPSLFRSSRRRLPIALLPFAGRPGSGCRTRSSAPPRTSSARCS